MIKFHWCRTLYASELVVEWACIAIIWWLIEKHRFMLSLKSLTNLTSTDIIEYIIKTFSWTANRKIGAMVCVPVPGGVLGVRDGGIVGGGRCLARWIVRPPMASCLCVNWPSAVCQTRQMCRGSGIRLAIDDRCWSSCCRSIILHRDLLSSYKNHRWVLKLKA